MITDKQSVKFIRYLVVGIVKIYGQMVYLSQFAF